MRYKMIYRPQNVLSIEVDELLVKSSTPLFEGVRFSWTVVDPDGNELVETLEDEMTTLVKDLFEIDGVASVELKRYEVIVRKGSLHEWKNIWRKVLGIIQTNIAPMGNFFIVGQPVYAYVDENGLYHEELIIDPDAMHPAYFSSQPH